MQELGQCFAGSLHRFLPLILSPWFVFGAVGGSVSLKEILSAAQGHLPDTITLSLGTSEEAYRWRKCLFSVDFYFWLGGS